MTVCVATSVLSIYASEIYTYVGHLSLYFFYKINKGSDVLFMFSYILY